MSRAGHAARLLAKAATSATLIAAAVMAGSYAYRRHAAKDDAAQAYRSYPRDAEAASGAFSLRLTQEPTFLPSAADAVNARAALRVRPLSPRLLYLAAVRAGMAGNTRGEQRIMRLADQVTRRDPLNQVWLIEDAVNRGDIAGALRHYHAALTVGPQLRPMLLPVLTAASSYPEIRAGLRSYIAGGADWAGEFLEQAAQSASVADLADLVMPVANSLAGPAYDQPRAAVISALAMGGRADLGFALASRTIPELKRADLRTLAFTPTTTDPRLGVLAWSLPQSDKIASLVGDDGSLGAQVGQLANATLVARAVPVMPGRAYEFLQFIAYDDKSPRARINWSAECIDRSGSRKIWDQAVPAPDKPATYRSIIHTPADCHLMRIVASVEGADMQAFSVFRISKIKLNPI